MTNDKHCKKSRRVEDDTDISVISEGPDISVGQVRDDVKNVIETMGTSIPKPIESPRVETDIEEPYTEQSIYSSIIEITELGGEGDRRIFDSSIDNSVSINLSEPKTCEGCDYSMECVDGRTMSPVSQHVSIQYRSPYPPNARYYPNGVNMQPQNPVHVARMQGAYPPNDLQQYQRPIPEQPMPQRPSRLAAWLGMKNNKRQPCNCNTQCDLYKINIEQPMADQSPPRRLVFDLMEELPKAPSKSKATNTKQKKAVANKTKKNPVLNPYDGGYPNEKVDIYYFDHGNSEFYRTTDITPAIITEYLAERTERYTKKFWAQLFGTFHIGIAFVISFVLQLGRFILQAIVRPLVVGIPQLISDYFLKPFLAVIFNGILQPPMIFLYNWMTSFRDLMHPVAETLGYFFREIAVILEAIRLFQYGSNNKTICCKNKAQEEGSGLENK